MGAELGIIPAAGNLIVRRLTNTGSGGIMSPGSEKGTECEVIATSEDSATFAIGQHVFVARTVGVPIGGDDSDNDDLWFVGIDDVLGWKREAR